MLRVFEKLRAELGGESDRSRLARASAFTGMLKLASTALAFGASLIYARALGPHGYGLYAYVFAWAGVLTLPASLGVHEYLVREAGRAAGAEQALRRWADRWVIAAGLLVAALMLSAALIPQSAGARFLFVLAAPLPMLNALGYVRQSLLRARGMVVTSQWPVLVLGPGWVLSSIGALWAIEGGVQPYQVIAASTIGAVLVMVVGQIQLRRKLGATSVQVPTVQLRAALPFMWLGVLFLINSRVDLIMLGTLKGAYWAGIYAVAARAAELVPFFFGVINLVIAPRIAQYHYGGQKVLLQRLVSASSRRVLFLSIPLALLLLIAAPWLLKLLYGTAFEVGALPLRLLAAAQLVNVSAGSLSLILNMTGHERLTAVGVGLAALFNVIFNAVLIPFFGILGAAIATSGSMILWTAMLWFLVRRHTGLRPSAFGI